MNSGNYCRPLWLLPPWQRNLSGILGFMYFQHMSRNPEMTPKDKLLHKQSLLVYSTRLEF
jgi:hypothetical protein